MKKLISIALLIATVCLLASCSTNIADNETDAETTIPVTSPEGFEDVTAPAPEGTTAPDTEDGDETTATEETEPETEDETTAVDKISTPDEAVAAAKEWLGEVDNETGYKYAYSYDGTLEDGQTTYFKVRVSWFIEEQGRSSLCGYLLVSPEGEVSKYSW
ncbi:MAG: hypothetical protein IJD22_02360 [Clostridia bacterium]|nr:hypothetical protein [Clostridia bacterium]